MPEVERRKHERHPADGVSIRVFDEDTIVDALTYKKIISHLKTASTDGRRREQMRCRIALKTIAKFRKEIQDEVN